MDPDIFAAVLDHRARDLRIVDVDTGEVVLVIPDKEDRTEGGFFLLAIVQRGMSVSLLTRSANVAQASRLLNRSRLNIPARKGT